MGKIWRVSGPVVIADDMKGSQIYEIVEIGERGLVGEIIGLERDYTSLKGNRDEFELHLRNLVNSHFGKVFASKNLEISFPISEDNEICQVEIKKSIKPVYLMTVNNNGMKSERFYTSCG